MPFCITELPFFVENYHLTTFRNYQQNYLLNLCGNDYLEALIRT